MKKRLKLWNYGRFQGFSFWEIIEKWYIIVIMESQIQIIWEEDKMDVLKVSAQSNPNSVAGALAGVVRESGAAEIQAIGAGALNQAVKAVAISRGFLAPSGIELICIPAFTDILIDGEERTAIRLLVEPRQVRSHAM